MSLDTFEQSLLGELRRHVADRNADPSPAQTAPRRRWAIGLSGGGLAAAAAVVAISLGVDAAGPNAAYAITSKPDGDLVVSVYDFADANGLEQALSAKGVQAQITYVRGFGQPDGQTRSTSGADGSCAIALAKVDGGLQFTLAAAQIASGATLEIVTAGTTSGDVGSPAAVTWSGSTC